MKIHIISVLSVSILMGCFSSTERMNEARVSKADLTNLLENNMIRVWYPKAIDTVYGGFLSDFDAQWNPEGPQNKFLVTQSRHVWTLSKLSGRYPSDPMFREAAKQGFGFLLNYMWDKEYGGFYEVLDRSGNPLELNEKLREKRTYGNAFALYGLAAYSAMSGDEDALENSIELFNWIENHAYDSVYGGYFQSMTRQGEPLLLHEPVSLASDSIRFYLKDMNTTIHLMEAYSELYRIWPEPVLRKRLEELVGLIRDKITRKEGYMNLYFSRDWTPVSFQDSVRKDYQLDHVSFGHDIETAYLLLEASDALGRKDDPETLGVSKKLLDHTLRNGIDTIAGGIYEEGYYFNDSMRIVNSTKNWWSQAEGLNTLSLFDEMYPDSSYDNSFRDLYAYISTYMVDSVHGGWYEKGLDKEPEYVDKPKAHNWKGSYHTMRSVMHCLDRMKD